MSFRGAFRLVNLALIPLYNTPGFKTHFFITNPYPMWQQNLKLGVAAVFPS